MATHGEVAVTAKGLINEQLVAIYRWRLQRQHHLMASIVDSDGRYLPQEAAQILQDREESLAKVRLSLAPLIVAPVGFGITMLDGEYNKRFTVDYDDVAFVHTLA